MAEPRVRKFQIIEQHDGRYIVVCPPFPTSMGWDARGETLIPWESNCRSHNEAYTAIAEYMISSGEYADNDTQIAHIRYPA